MRTAVEGCSDLDFWITLGPYRADDNFVQVSLKSYSSVHMQLPTARP